MTENYIDIVLDGPPDHDPGRFVEVENEAGESINAGRWIERDDGYWVLRIEQAHTPTDDEQEALAVIVAYVEDDYQREHGTLNGSAMATAEAILAAGFRRSEVPEPQGEPSAGNLDHYTDPDDPFWQSRPEPVPQGEPSEAQVRAGALAMYRLHPGFSMSGASDLFRAALRAAAEARGESRG